MLKLYLNLDLPRFNSEIISLFAYALEYALAIPPKTCSLKV